MEGSTILTIILGLLLVAGLVCLVAAGWAFFVGKKHLARYLRPNPQDIERDRARLEQQAAQQGIDVAVSQYINQQALFLGLVGALTGLGGAFVMLLGMPLDLSVTTLRQMKMAHVIAALYGNQEVDRDQMEIRFMSLVAGGAGAARILAKLIGTSIPVAGSVVNFAINYVTTKSIGATVQTWGRGERVRDAAGVRYEQLKQSVAAVPLNGLPQANTIAALLNRPSHAAPSPMSPVDRASAAPPVTYPPRYPQNVPQTMLANAACSGCGRNVAVGVKFCAHCGTPPRTF